MWGLGQMVAVRMNTPTGTEWKLGRIIRLGRRDEEGDAENNEFEMVVRVVWRDIHTQEFIEARLVFTAADITNGEVALVEE